jgi:transcription elongation factor Elf1
MTGFRMSLRESIKHLLDSTQDQVCPRCGSEAAKQTVEIKEDNGQSHDLVLCQSCGFSWQSAFRIAMSPIINLENK